MYRKESQVSIDNCEECILNWSGVIIALKEVGDRTNIRLRGSLLTSTCQCMVSPESIF